MPGIAGLVTRLPRECAEARLGRMLGVMRHAPFYVTRTWVDQELALYVGWTAHEGSFGDSAALVNESGDVALIVSGEEYPAPERIDYLKTRGHQVGSSRGSYLVHAYEEDSSFPANLNGRFHGIVADRRTRRVLLFNDRYGMHRIYWHESDDAVYFAAEAKAILAVCPEVRELEARALGEVISLGCTLENRSLFKGVHVLPGGSLWVFEDGTLIRRGVYFRPEEWEGQSVVDADTSYQEIRAVFSRILPRYLAGSERIGMSLTGGLDTRMVMAWQRCAPGTLPCYTFGGSYRDCQDVKFARKIAEACRQPFTVISIGDEFLKRFADYAERAVVMTDGSASPRHAPDVYINESARRVAPVRLTGLYGGEVLRGARLFKPTAPSAGLFPALGAEIAEASAAFARVIQGHPVSFAVFRQAPWHHYNSLCPEQTQVTVRSPFLDNDFVKAVFRAPSSMTASDHASMRLVADGTRLLASIPTDRGLDGSGSLKEKLANAVQEFTFKAEYACDYGMPQWLAACDHAFRSLRFERLFLGRHKIMHFRVWYRGPLSAYVREILLDRRSLARPYLDRRMVERIVRLHIRGEYNYTTEIHRLLQLELVCRHLLDGSVPAVTWPPPPANVVETTSY